MEQRHLQQEPLGEETWVRAEAEATERNTEVTDLNTEAERVEQRQQPEIVGRLGRVLRRDTYRRLASMALFPFLPFPVLLALKAMLSEEAWIHLCTDPVFVTTTLVTSVGLLLAQLRPSRQAKQAADRLSALEDVGAIRGLVETLSFGHDREVNAPARETLIRLLPRLKANDKGLLAERHFVMLRATLSASPYISGDLFAGLSQRLNAHTRLQIAILKAFEQIGDTQSLPVVTHLAKNAHIPQVRQAAEECLPFLQIRVEQERASQTLLRASSADGTDPTTLLRPAQGAPEHAPHEMLRPGAAPEPQVEDRSAVPDQIRTGVVEYPVLSAVLPLAAG